VLRGGGALLVHHRCRQLLRRLDGQRDACVRYLQRAAAAAAAEMHCTVCIRFRLCVFAIRSTSRFCEPCRRPHQPYSALYSKLRPLMCRPIEPQYPSDFLVQCMACPMMECCRVDDTSPERACGHWPFCRLTGERHHRRETVPFPSVNSGMTFTLCRRIP